jgi:hypothetical protein
MAAAPRSAAERPASDPRSLPMGVRAPATITDGLTRSVYDRPFAASPNLDS